MRGAGSTSSHEPNEHRPWMDAPRCELNASTLSRLFVPWFRQVYTPHSALAARDGRRGG
jgi:hypothetical protein